LLILFQLCIYNKDISNIYIVIDTILILIKLNLRIKKNKVSNSNEKIFSIFGGFVLLSFLVILILTIYNFNGANTADTIYKNGNILTVDSNFKIVTSFAIKDGKFIFVGSNEAELNKFKDSKTEIVDLKGKTILPGLNDAHIHFEDVCEKLSMPDINNKSKADILSIIKKVADETEPGKWIVSNGWNNNLWDDTSWPNHTELDAVTGDHPTILQRVDMHTIWANSLAIEAAGIKETDPDPRGGTIIRDSTGKIQGIFIDEARNPLLMSLPTLTNEEKLELWKVGQQKLFSSGITSFTDPGKVVPTKTVSEDIALLKSAYEKGDMKIRNYKLIPIYDFDDFLLKGNKAELNLFSGRLSFNGVKIFADGSFGSHSAWLSDDYADTPGKHGEAYLSDYDLYKIVKKARVNGFHIASHAIGDETISQILQVYERVQKELPTNDARYRIEHFSLPKESDIKKAADENVIIVIQPYFAPSDAEIIGKGLIMKNQSLTYPWRTAFDYGVILAGSSDGPVENYNPFEGIYAAVTRKGVKSNFTEAFNPNQNLTREEALKLYTFNAAYSQFAENIKGSIEVGKYADFIVIDRNYETVPVDELKDIKVLKTVLAGEVVYPEFK
jgi:predicted amidohydrolase YtcJ